MGTERKQGPLEPSQRWSARRKRDAVLRLLQGEPLEALSRELGVELYRLEAWRDKALQGMENALKKREGDPLDTELKIAKQHIGELSMEVEVLRKEVELHRPLTGRRSRK
jgi:predicted  nucleic acid-binding Zn-ribbon protein